MEQKVLSHTEIEENQWDDFIRNSPQGALYHVYGYLGIIAPSWQTIIVEDKGRWLGVMPFSPRKKFGFRASLQAPFGQYWGICFASELGRSPYEQFSLKRKIVMAMVERLRGIDLFIHNFSPAFDYPLPFMWDKFTLKTRYTYQLNLEPSFETLLQNMAAPLRRQVAKAEKSGFRFSEIQEVNLLREFHASQGDSKGIHDPQQVSLLGDLAKYLIQHDKGKLFCVKDFNDTVIAIALIGFFRGTAIYLQGFYAPGTSSASMSFLLTEGIKSAKEMGMVMFDFEGSMIEPIERFFRKFGAQPVPYLQIRKNDLPFLIRWIRDYT